MPANQNQIKVLLVDDEKEACENLKNLLLEFVGDEINIVGVAYNTRDAEALIAKTAPDAVFLDIEMPNENAFQFLERVSPVNYEVLFVTAYDDYAIRAFKLNAVDYILKPISIPELVSAVKKLRERVGYKKIIAASPTSFAEMGQMMANKTKGHKITLKDGSNIEVVDFKNIYFVEAHGSYARVLFSKNNVTKELVMSVSLSVYEELLPDDLFYRIHKSFLINCMHVNRLIRDEVAKVVINNEFTLPISRRRFAPLVEFLKNNDYYNE